MRLVDTPLILMAAEETSSGMGAIDAGAFIKARRKALGMTQTQLVAATGLSGQNYLSAIESGKYHVGHSKYLRRIAAALGLSEAEIKAINPDLFVVYAERHVC